MTLPLSPASPARPRTGADAPAATYALRAGRMFDGFTLSGPVTVRVRRDRVLAVDRTGSIPPGVPLVDLGDDVCLLPGLVDVRAHLALDAGPDPVGSLVAADDERLLARMRVAARTALHAGVTTVRDVGDRGFLASALAERTAADPGLGPEILAAGPPITTPGGHGHALGGAAVGTRALVEAVRERHARGCSLVTIVASGDVRTPGSDPRRAQYTRDELRTVADEAHRLGLPVAAHAHGVVAIEDALAAGVDSLEHASFLGGHGAVEELRLQALVAGSGTFVSMTPVREPGAYADTVHAAYRALIRLGARIAVGSDAGTACNRPHDSLPYAPLELTALGASPLEALKAVTSRAAALCGVGGRKGRIRAGSDADFLAVGGDPLAGLAALRDVRAVFRAGVRIR
ncbi:amidohydrolase family protein [Streptomyces sp. NPDC088354]|uniref:amidohydrolase family protein n=1 Tax=Streptomyces sp. NPDC088354 TaxID=3365856 RepID=UPI003817CCB1